MLPGTLFVLENAGEVGEKGPLLGRAFVPIVWDAGLGHAQAGGRLVACDLRVGPMFRTVFYSRQRDRAAKAHLMLERECESYGKG